MKRREKKLLEELIDSNFKKLESCHSWESLKYTIAFLKEEWGVYKKGVKANGTSS